MDQLMAFCRPGFETEAGRELVDAAMAEGIFGYFEPGKDQGLVRFILTGHESAPDLLARVRLDDLVFVRDWFVVLGNPRSAHPGPGGRRDRGIARRGSGAAGSLPRRGQGSGEQHRPGPG